MMRWLSIALLAFGAWHWWGSRGIERAPGVIAAAAPEFDFVVGHGSVIDGLTAPSFFDLYQA